VTTADREKIIHDVTKILYTLLMAGYQTSATSLSYVMYCLSTNPRCTSPYYSQHACFPRI
jgi:cytochrome P450